MKSIERLIPHARDRAVVWSAISHFTIEPPERFYSNMVVDVARDAYGEVTETTYGINQVRVNYELGLLGRFGMVERLPKNAANCVIWHIRVNPEAWDEAQPLLIAHLNQAAPQE